MMSFLFDECSLTIGPETRQVGSSVSTVAEAGNPATCAFRDQVNASIGSFICTSIPPSDPTNDISSIVLALPPVFNMMLVTGYPPKSISDLVSDEVT
jgi:hypothetical protein